MRVHGRHTANYFFRLGLLACTVLGLAAGGWGEPTPYVQDRGSLIVVCDATYDTALPAEFAQLVLDLEGEGWRVDWNVVDVATATVPSVKSLIMTRHAALGNAKGVLLFGDIPDPKSGYAGPDGHAARPMYACTYYGDITGHASWTDVGTWTSGDPDNLPGDGVFDQNDVPNSTTRTPQLDMFVGRIRSSGQKWFDPLSPVELMRRYLVKNHRYRAGELRAPYTSEQCHRHTYQIPATLDDASDLFGQETVDYSKTWDLYLQMRSMRSAIYTVISTAGHIYGGNQGGASHQHADPLEPRFLFLSNFHSYSVELRDNAILPASVLGERWGLLAYWGYWGLWVASTASSDVPFGITQTTRLNRSSGAKTNIPVYANITGDASLRLWVVDPPRNLNAETSGASNVLTWDASAEAMATDSGGAVGYAVFRSDSLHGTFSLISGAVITGLTFTDTAPLANSHYRVHAIATFRNFATADETFQVRSLPARVQLDRSGGGATPPTASLSIEQRQPHAPTEVKFIASASDSPAGAIERYHFDFGDGATTTTRAADAWHSYRHPGQYNVSVTVTDVRGQSDTASGLVDLKGYIAPLYLGELLESHSDYFAGQIAGRQLLVNQQRYPVSGGATYPASFPFRYLTVNGVRYPTCVMSMGNSVLRFNLDGQFSRLETGIAFVSTSSGHTCIFKVRLDGVEQTLRTIKPDEGPFYYDLDLTGVQVLELVTTESSPDTIYAGGAWVSPRIYPVPQNAVSALIEGPRNVGATQRVALDGRGSLGEITEYAWSQTAGPAVSIQNEGGAAVVYFDAPDVLTSTTFGISLQVRDAQGHTSSFSHDVLVWPSGAPGVLFAEGFADEPTDAAPRVEDENGLVKGNDYRGVAQTNPYLGNWTISHGWPHAYQDGNFRLYTLSGSDPSLIMRDQIGPEQLRLEKRGVRSASGITKYSFKVQFYNDAATRAESYWFYCGTGDLMRSENRFAEVYFQNVANESSVATVTLNGGAVHHMPLGAWVQIDLLTNHTDAAGEGVAAQSADLYVNGALLANDVPGLNPVACDSFGFYTSPNEQATTPDYNIYGLKLDSVQVGDAMALVPGTVFGSSPAPATTGKPGIPQGWDASAGQMSFDLYSRRANGQEIALIFASENPDSTGADYYSYRLTVDWTGWKQFTLPFSSFVVSRQPLGWDRLTDITFHTTWFSGMTLFSDTYMSVYRLTSGAPIATVTPTPTITPTPTVTPTSVGTATPTPTPTSLATATPTSAPGTPTPTPTSPSAFSGFDGAQSCSIASDGHFYAAVYDLNTGDTAGWADENGSAILEYTLVPLHWFGIYVYDYASADWASGLYTYVQPLN